MLPFTGLKLGKCKAVIRWEVMIPDVYKGQGRYMTRETFQIYSSMSNQIGRVHLNRYLTLNRYLELVHVIP